MQRLEPGDPRTVGPYRVLARIGTGGMAAVYLARSRGGRSVAVKVMHADLAREAAHRERFRREVAANSAAGGVHSPSVLAADPDDGMPWMATEFLPSLTLRDAVERFGALPAHSVRRLAAGLAEALADLHRAGIAHLDVTPANVLLTADGPRLIDFGIAAGVTPAPPPDSVSTTVSGHAGSWGFMSPEQVEGVAGPPSDVYSLGTTLEYACGGADAAGARGAGDGAPGDGRAGGRPTVDHRSARDRYGSAPPDAALRALVADCRRPDPDARPCAAELVRRLAPGQEESEAPAATWLPPQVTAAIDENASAADNPPTPAPLPPGRRRVLLGGVVAAVTAVGTAAVLATRSAGSPSGAGAGTGPQARRTPAVTRTGTQPPTGASGATAASATPSAMPVPLVFEITGTGTLTMLAYGVNGRLTRTRRTQKLPWRKTVDVPQGGGATDWQIMLTLGSGTARCRVLLDGRTLFDQRAPRKVPFGPTYPSDVSPGGSVATSGPPPSLNG
ncbi:serine/threonine-protein kinase [Streptomyces sp. NBC_01477]|uniref:serine/threonine-protein kinase n=1 Tax=Streptomyces sp. NBC_01477 TaxID=2976015 RepID=UPI002E34DEC9|nr:serine/threonine-protein kinase [Streptomyces sp. NBC_01477]